MQCAGLTALPPRTMLALGLAALAAGLSAQTTSLQLGKTIQGDLPAGQTQSYSIALVANQYLRAVITQPVAAVMVELYDPDGKKVLEVDTRNFRSKPSRVVWIAETAGEFRISVRGAGHYEVKLEELRAAGADDGKRVDAERSFTQGLDQARRNAHDQAISTYTRALGLYREVGDREREGDTLHATGTAYYNLSQYEKAIGYYEQALAIRREVKDRQGEGATLNNLGNACYRLSQNEKAFGYYEQALAIRREMKDRQGEASTLTNLGYTYGSLGQYEKAIEYIEQALPIEREVKDRQGEGETLNGLGIASFNLSQYERAIGYYEQALAIFREVRDRLREGGALSNLGATYVSLGQYEKAVRYLEQALAIRREVKDRLGEGNDLSNLGAAYQALSQRERAIGYYEQALAIRRAVKDRLGEGATLSNLGNAYTQLSQYEKAIDYFERALAIQREIEDRRSEGLTLGNLAGVYLELRQYEKAIGYYELALGISREVKDRSTEGMILNNLGASHGGLGQYAEAIGYCEQALAIAREVQDRQGEGAASNNLGDAYNGQGQSEKAIAYYAQALAISREVKDRRTEAAELAGLMNTWQASGRPRLAIFYGKQAVNTVQSMRSDIADLRRDLQQSFLKGNEKPYHTLAEILIAQGRLTEAEQVLALLKEEEYFQYIRRDAEEASSLKRRADLTPKEAEYEKRYREIGDRLMTIGVERGDLLAKKSLTEEQKQRLGQLEYDLAAGNQAFEHFLGELTQHFSAKPEMARSIDILRETQGIMENLREFPAGTVAIFTLIGDDKFYAVLRTPDAQKAYEYSIKAADLNRKIFEFRDVVQHPELDPRPLAQELYKILIANMAGDLRQAKAQTLMWSLDGALRYVPLAALYDGKQYLIEQYRMSVMTLASEMSLKDLPDRKWKAAGFGVTKEFEDASALPSVSSELSGIITTRPGDGGVLAGEIKLDDQFTQQAMRQTLLKRYPVVHIASHFHFQPGNQTKSFLQLGDGGHFSLADLKTSANLFGGVQLLTLSACNTGVGDGTEVEGFGTLAQRQGAKAVVASLWPVADESTSRLMQEFYRIRESTRNMTKLEALRQSQLKLLHGDVKVKPGADRGRREVPDAAHPETAHPEAPRFRLNPEAPFAHPFYWAPFFLMGNWR